MNPHQTCVQYRMLFSIGTLVLTIFDAQAQTPSYTLFEPAQTQAQHTYTLKNPPKKKLCSTSNLLKLGTVVSVGMFGWLYRPQIIQKYRAMQNYLKNSPRHTGPSNAPHHYHICNTIKTELNNKNIHKKQLVSYLESKYTQRKRIKQILKANITPDLQAIINKIAHYGDQYALPNDIENNQDYTVLHLKGNQQHGATCGAHALYHAKAIELLLHKNQPLTAQAIKDKAREIQQKHPLSTLPKSGVWMKERDMPQGMDILHLDNWQIFNCQYLGMNQPQQLINHIKVGNIPCAHFIIYTPMFNNQEGHWTLASLVPQNNKNPLLIYIDSLNNPVHNGDHAHTSLSKLIH